MHFPNCQDGLVYVLHRGFKENRGQHIVRFKSVSLIIFINNFKIFYSVFHVFLRTVRLYSQTWSLLKYSMFRSKKFCFQAVINKIVLS